MQPLLELYFPRSELWEVETVVVFVAFNVALVHAIDLPLLWIMVRMRLMVI